MKRWLFMILIHMLLTGLALGAENPFAIGRKGPVAPSAHITGTVLLPDKTPMQNCVAMLFSKETGPPPSPYGYWRIPDLLSGMDQNGKFSVEAPGGVYYLQAAQKDPNGEIGPAQRQEYFYFHGDAEGRAIPIVLESGKTVDLGKLQAVLWSPELIQRETGITAVEGVVVDQEGHPVDKALVFAYLSPDAKGRPQFVSDRTSSDGRYQLRVHDSGTYYLKVRSIYGGGAPKEGEYLNSTTEFKPEMVQMKKGERLKGVNLKVKKFSKLKPKTGTSPAKGNKSLKP
jgi:hypothetical protein